MSNSIAIIDAGKWGEMFRERGDYDGHASTLKASLEERDVEVQVATSTDEAQSWLASRGGGTALFTSRGMVREARQLISTDPKIRVVLFTGLVPVPVPDDGIVWVGKAWPLDEIWEAILGK